MALQNMPNTKTVLSAAASVAASAMLIRTITNDFVPNQVQDYFYSSLHNIFHHFSSEFTIVIDEFSGLSLNQVFEAANVYLGTKMTPSTQRIKLGKSENEKNVAITVDRDEEIVDSFEDVQVKWRLICTQVESASNNHHGQHLRDVIDTSKAIKEEGKGIKLRTVDYNGYWNSDVVNLDHPMTLSSRSILIIEDIDCSIKLQNRESDGELYLLSSYTTSLMSQMAVVSLHKVTLSGLLNFIDGLWSCCGDERIIIFTTNHKDRLDPALLRPGRMDMHIHMSYCTFSAFQQLAINYLGIYHHQLFEKIEEHLRKAEITPAEVAGELMKNTDSEVSLQGLLKFLETSFLISYRRTLPKATL